MVDSPVIKTMAMKILWALKRSNIKPVIIMAKKPPTREMPKRVLAVPMGSPFSLTRKSGNDIIDPHAGDTAGGENDQQHPEMFLAQQAYGAGFFLIERPGIR